MARYATDRSSRVTSLLLAGAWLMALAISLPIYVELNGFSNWVRRVNRWGFSSQVGFIGRGVSRGHGGVGRAMWRSMAPGREMCQVGMVE